MVKIIHNKAIDIDKKIKTTDIIKYHFNDIQKIKYKLVKLRN